MRGEGSNFHEKLKNEKDTPHFGMFLRKNEVDDMVILKLISVFNHHISFIFFNLD